MAEVLITLAILLATLIRLRREYRKRGSMSEWLSAALLKLSGAAVGSAVAVGFKPGKDGWGKLLFRWFSGTWVGVIGCHYLIDKMKWPNVPVYELFSASLLGVTGYLILQFILSGEAKSLLLGVFTKKLDRENIP